MYRKIINVSLTRLTKYTNIINNNHFINIKYSIVTKADTFCSEIKIVYVQIIIVNIPYQKLYTTKAIILGNIF